MKGFFTETTLKRTDLPHCDRCGLFRGCASPKMGVFGEGRRCILVVGEAPGEQEDKRGRPFVGRAGKELREALDKCGVDLDRDCWTTNSIICRPPGNKMNPLYLKSCQPALLGTIEKLKPHVIILLGACAVEQAIQEEWTTGIGQLSKWRGWRIPSSLFNSWVCPTYHPSFVMRSKDVPVIKLFFEQDLAAAIQCEKKGLSKYETLGELESQVELVTSPAGANARLRDLARDGEGLLAFDYETTGLKPDSPAQRIVSCSFCLNGEETWACPMDENLLEPLRAVLESRSMGKVASNLKFEERWSLAKVGCGVRNWHWDTMQAAHCLDNRPGITSVKFQAFVRLGVGSYETGVAPYLKAKRANGLNRIDQVPLKDLLLYNGLDSLLEYRVMEHQKKEMRI
jgi:DNA polymerase